jgi:DNA-binding NtrC family response regulator
LELNLAEFAPILVVDNQSNTRSELTKNLKDLGFESESVSDATQALDKLVQKKYCMVIANAQTAGIDGRNILTYVKEKSLQVPVILTTKNGTVGGAVEAMQAGASDYLLVPFSIEILGKTVKKVIRLSTDIKETQNCQKSSYTLFNDRKIITRNRKLAEILRRAKSVAPSNATVLVQGESGTGKELLASYIHCHSRNSLAPYVAVNCAALPETLAESELFGHEKGAFTGAISRKVGKFELAKQGTVVLDEISETPLPLQAKLLRVLQEKEIDRIGGSRPIPINARIVAISNVNLRNAVKEGKFRQDLYYRINVIPLTLPPLRERRDDIELLAIHFLKKHCRANQKNLVGIDDKAMKILQDFRWKGNVRELENTMERAVLISTGGPISPEHLWLDYQEKEKNSEAIFHLNSGYTVREMEKELIVRTLEDVNDNRTQAAELLGISIRTLRNKLRDYRQESEGGCQHTSTPNFDMDIAASNH